MKYKKLIDIASVVDSLHQTPKYSDEGIPMVRVTDVKGGRLSLKDCFKVDEQVYKKFTANHEPTCGDIVISRVGTYGNFSFVSTDERFCLGQNTAIITPHINPDFLYYCLISQNVKNQIEQKVVGSTQKTLSLKNIKELEIPDVDEKTQEKIAGTLRNLDEKIEVNSKINDNLSAQIETFLLAYLDSEDTSTVKLGDYLYIKGRIGWKGLKKSEYLPQSEYRIINGETLTQSGIDWNKAGYISEERYAESPEIMLKVGDILLSKDGTIGKIGYVDSLELPTSVASGIFVIRNTKPDIMSTTFIYYLLKSRLFTSFIAARTEGSVIPHLYQKDFMEFEFPLPIAEKMAEFEEVAEPMFSQIVNNLNENKRLAILRDSLLPKLMSGELDVSDLDL